LLRCLHAEADESKLRRVFRQLLQSGKQLLHAAREGGKVRRETR
jgi:hypothetical protein